MEQNGFWKGGRTIDKDGYSMVKINDHPDANGNGYVREHRLVMARKLNRPLLSDEVVHHKDGNRANNDPDNLFLYESNAAHLAETLRGKCPQWSEEGFQKMRERGRALAETSAAIHEGLKTYARMHSESPAHFLKSLGAEDRHLLRMAVRLGRLESLDRLRTEREKILSDWLALQSPRYRRKLDRKSAFRS